MRKLISKIYWGVQKHPPTLNTLLNVIAGIIIGLVIFFITSLFTNKQTQHNLVIECRNLGEKINKEIAPKGASVLDPEFYYNPKLKKCLYCGGYTEDGYMFKVIIDAYTNKEIASYLRSLKQPSLEELTAASQFEYKKRKLFNDN